MENLENSTIDELTDSIENMGNAMGRLKVAYYACLESGITPNEVRDKILEKLPEDERAQFMQQWPMLSMMLAAL